MCYASKYPEAFPLNKVDAQSVAEALMDVLASTSIPDEILTDQGSIFMSYLDT